VRQEQPEIDIGRHRAMPVFWVGVTAVQFDL
jgi:hypothetical protein